MVPVGTWHNIKNTGETELKLYAIYAPSHHAANIAQATAADAAADEEAGTEKPPS